MKGKEFLLNTLLATVVGLVLLAALVWKTLFPAAVLPALDVPILTALALIALVLDFYLAPGVKRCWCAVALLAAAVFGLRKGPGPGAGSDFPAPRADGDRDGGQRHKAWCALQLDLFG